MVAPLLGIIKEQSKFANITTASPMDPEISLFIIRSRLKPPFCAFSAPGHHLRLLSLQYLLD